MASVAPRSAALATVDASDRLDPYLEMDTAAAKHPYAHPRNRYQEALRKEQEAPWWQRIASKAIIFPTAIVGAGLAMHQIAQLPGIKNAVEHPNAWVRYPAQFAKFVSEWAIMDLLIEFATIGFWRGFF